MQVAQNIYCLFDHLCHSVTDSYNDLSEKVNRAAIIAFKAAKELYQTTSSALSPYFGGKSFSIIGLMIRSPYHILRYFLGMEPNLKEALFGKGYHLFIQNQISEQEGWDTYLVHCLAAAATHGSNPIWLKQSMGYNTIDPHEEFPNFVPEGFELLPSRTQQGKYVGYINTQTGLKIMLFRKNDEILVSFGAKNAHTVDFDKKDPQRSVSLTNKARINLLKNTFGLLPDYYDDALNCTKSLLPYLEGKNITFTGLCVGGAIAHYVGLQLEMEAVGVNPLPLGVAAQAKIGQEKLSRSDEFLSSLSVKGDLTSDCLLFTLIDWLVNVVLGVKTPGVWGKRYSIPSAFPLKLNNPYNAVDKTHTFPIGSMARFLGIAPPKNKQDRENFLSTLATRYCSAKGG